MTRKIISTLLLITVVSVASIGCSNGTSDEVESLNAQISELNAEIESLEAQIEVLENEPNVPEQTSLSLISSALAVVEILDEEDFSALASWIHPTNGLRFSPYAYVNVQTDQVFQAQDFPAAATNTSILTWGAFDGSGEPIEYNFMDYYNRFVYDQDFLNPEMIGINSIIGFGNTLVNIGDAYPGASFVEFHFSGFDPQYDGMDWRSLILVMEELNGEWKLVGIVHNEWTI